MGSAVRRFGSRIVLVLSLIHISLLTDDELAVVRRGRNVKSRSHPKNADISEYHGATGFEALWGYLYLSGDRERMANLFEIIVNTNLETE